MFVMLPSSVVAAGVKRVYRHKDLAEGSPRHHDFVIVKVTRVPEGVKGPYSGWPLPQSEWRNAGVLKGGIFGVSTSGDVEGSYLEVSDPNEPVGLFLQTHGEPSQSGTLLFSGSGLKPLGVYHGVYRSLTTSMGRRPRGVCVPIPPRESQDWVGFKPRPVPEAPVEYSYEWRSTDQGTRYCHLSCDGKRWVIQENGQESYDGVLVEDDHSYVGKWVCGAAKAK
jgi:hypothetical protein